MARKITRRAALGSIAAAAAGLTVRPSTAISQPGPTTSDAAPPAGSRVADVAIVGAGFAGLTAARALRSKGVNAIVIEARDRVGGRVLNQDLTASGFPGRVIEMGGEFVGPLPNEPATASFPTQAVYNPQARVLELAASLGIKTFKTYDEGDYINYLDGVGVVRYSSSTRIPPDPSLVNSAFALYVLNEMAKKVDPAEPWSAPRARTWDHQTFESWMRKYLLPRTSPNAATNHLVSLALEAVMSVEPGEISLLEVLFYIASAGNFDNLIDTTNGAQDSRFIGGSQSIPIAMAAELGDDLILGAPVRRIDHDGLGRVVVRGEGFDVTASRCIVAVPPALAGRIVYDPPLGALSPRGALRDQLTQRFPMTSIVKINVLYPRPFWRDDGLAGQVTSQSGAVRVTFDNTPYPDPYTSDVTPGCIIGFIEADEARYWTQRTRTERYEQVVKDLGNYFGPQALAPLGGIDGYFEMLWNAEEFSAGGPIGIPTPGTLVQYGRSLREPIGLIHWAGTETATRWCGYMDGAVESGQRAAAEVFATLAAATSSR